jgi:hypothetical protein
MITNDQITNDDKVFLLTVKVNGNMFTFRNLTKLQIKVFTRQYQDKKDITFKNSFIVHSSIVGFQVTSMIDGLYFNIKNFMEDVEQ